MKTDEEGRHGLQLHLGMSPSLPNSTEELTRRTVESLTEAGANPLCAPLHPNTLLALTRSICRIKNKHGLRPIDLLPPPPPPSRNGATTSDAELDGTEAVRAALRRAEAEFAMTSGGPGNDDIASGESSSDLYGL